MLPSDEPFAPQMSRIEEHDAMALRFAADAIAAHRAFVYNPTSFERDRLRDAGDVLVRRPLDRLGHSATVPTVCGASQGESVLLFQGMGKREARYYPRGRGAVASMRSQMPSAPV